MRKSIVRVAGLWAVVAGAVLSASADELEIARAALRDGLWQVARTHAAGVDSDDARLVILESYASENRWDDVKAELERGGSVTNTPAAAYYRAVVDGKLEDAVTALQKAGSAAGQAEAKMLEADLQVRRAHPEAARALWTEVVAMSNASERAFATASLNLGDEKILREAYRRTLGAVLRHRVGLRLGRVLLESPLTAAEGANLIREIVADTPDVEGAREAFVAVARAELRDGLWLAAEKTYADAVETWVDAARLPEVQQGRGEALLKLGRNEEALAAFVRAEELASGDVLKARAVLCQGEALSGLGRGAEAMARYRQVLEKYPTTETAATLKRLVDLREREVRGRELYKSYQFDEARRIFAEIAVADPSRKARMDFLEVLCLYGLGRDQEAFARVRALSATCGDALVHAKAVLWQAKFCYNSRNWREAIAQFTVFAELCPTDANAPVALLWAARAAFAANDFVQAIQLATRLAGRYPEAPAVVPALLIQAEALVEQARFDEALLVLDRVVADTATGRGDRLRARLLKADALFAMGADNPARYEAALEAYRAVRFGEELLPDLRLSVDFKIGRVFEKLKRYDDAIDQYYSQVVLAYCDGRRRGEEFGDEARAAFSRAAFRLADEFEDRKRNHQAVGVLKLVVESDVPAAKEAARRIRQISTKGLFL